MSRMGMFDDTYHFIPTQGWMFVPLIQYHGGEGETKEKCGAGRREGRGEGGKEGGRERKGREGGGREEGEREEGREGGRRE